MKSLIVYSSKSGNTKKLAEAVQANLPGEKVLAPIEENPDTKGFDLVVVGFWLQGGKADPIASKYLENLGHNNLFLLATHGAAANSEHAQNAMLSAQKLAASCHIIGSFSCQGEVEPDFLAKVQAKIPQPPWIKDAPAAAGHPDDVDIDNLREILKKIVS